MSSNHKGTIDSCRYGKTTIPEESLSRVCPVRDLNTHANAHACTHTTHTHTHKHTNTQTPTLVLDLGWRSPRMQSCKLRFSRIACLFVSVSSFHLHIFFVSRFYSNSKEKDYSREVCCSSHCSVRVRYCDPGWSPCDRRSIPSSTEASKGDARARAGWRHLHGCLDA